MDHDTLISYVKELAELDAGLAWLDQFEDKLHKPDNLHVLITTQLGASLAGAGKVESVMNHQAEHIIPALASVTRNVMTARRQALRSALARHFGELDHD